MFRTFEASTLYVISSYKGPPINEPSVAVVVSTTNSPSLSCAMWLSPAAMILIWTSESGGDTDPLIYKPNRPSNVGIIAWQPSLLTTTWEGKVNKETLIVESIDQTRDTCSWNF